MNFLAHAALSGNVPEILAGNMMGDYIRKSQEKNYPETIIRGVYLHREIDRFTDTHLLVKQCRKIFFPYIRHYALVVSDVLYDHFLGQYWVQYYSSSLEEFTAYTYQTLRLFREIFPPGFAFIFQRMSDHDWLSQYRDPEYLYASFIGLGKRSPAFIYADITRQVIEEHYAVLAAGFREFYPQLVAHCETFLATSPGT